MYGYSQRRLQLSSRSGVYRNSFGQESKVAAMKWDWNSSMRRRRERTRGVSRSGIRA